MGLTYTQKPAYIDRMIEVRSHHFFKALGHTSFAAAEAENGENIGIGRAALENARDALWNINKTLELYEALLESIRPLPVSDQAKKILKEFNYDALNAQITKAKTIAFQSEQWQEFVALSREQNPVAVIASFVEKVKGIRIELNKVVEDLTRESMSSQNFHAALRGFVNAMTFGQYIAEFNRTSREMFAARP